MAKIRLSLSGLPTIPRHLYLFIHIVYPLFLACNGKSTGTSEPFFRYNEEAGIGSLDPAYARDQAHTWAVSQLFDGLLRIDSQSNVIPALAKSWEIEAAGRRYVFHIRGGVKFHHGQVLRASDFVYSFNRLLDPAIASPGSWVFRGKVDSLRPFEAPNDTTLIINLLRPFTPMLKLLAMPYCLVVPEQIVKEDAIRFGRNPSGTGPFRFRLWEDGVRLVLERNEDYFESGPDKKVPSIAGVEISFIENRHAVFLEFAGGRLDFINGVDAGFKDELLTMDGALKPYYAARYLGRKAPYLLTEYLGFQLEKPEPEILGNQSFRSALGLAINRMELVQYLRNGIGQPAFGGILPQAILQGPASYGLRFQRSEARSIVDSLRSAGFIIPTLTLNTTKASLELAIYIQKQWEMIGVESKIEVSPGPSLRQKISAGKIGLFRASWIGDYPDAENFLTLLYSENTAPNGPNYTRYANPQFDRLFEKMNETEEGTYREAILRAADSTAMVDVPLLPLYYGESFHLMQKRVKYLPVNVLNVLDLRYAVVEN